MGILFPKLSLEGRAPGACACPLWVKGLTGLEAAGGCLLVGTQCLLQYSSVASAGGGWHMSQGAVSWMGRSKTQFLKEVQLPHWGVKSSNLIRHRGDLFSLSVWLFASSNGLVTSTHIELWGSLRALPIVECSLPM